MAAKTLPAATAPMTVGTAGDGSLRQRLTVVLLMLMILTGFSTEAAAQQSALVFERIKQSLPRQEVGWRVTEADEPYRQRNGLTQASFVWTGGDEEVRATVILHKSLKAAKEQFRRPPKNEPAMESFRVDDLGDEAYLFPPIILNQTGPFNLWFRKGQFEISMSADSKATLMRCAKYLVEAIASPGERIPTGAAGSRR